MFAHLPCMDARLLAAILLNFRCIFEVHRNARTPLSNLSKNTFHMSVLSSRFSNEVIIASKMD